MLPFSPILDSLRHSYPHDSHINCLKATSLPHFGTGQVPSPMQSLMPGRDNHVNQAHPVKQQATRDKLHIALVYLLFKDSRLFTSPSLPPRHL